MPACKDKYLWCKDEPSVYEDNEGKEHCVFHAPRGKKGKEITLENFNEKVFRKIADVIRENRLPGSKGNQICDLSGTIFEGDIGFNVYNKDNPLPRINFSRAAFSGKADFSRAAFSEEARFLDATFSGEANFIEAAFSGKANFFYAAFSDEADFSYATFSGNAGFNHAKFSGKANFRGAKFSEGAGFSLAAFSDEADFSYATFSGNAWFNYATFSGKANFMITTFNGEAGFDNAKFSEMANFSFTKFSGGVYFYSGIFKKVADENDVDAVVFEEGAKGLFERGADFSNFSAKEEIKFKGINLEEVSFLNSDLRNCDFINCEWQKKSGRNVLYDEASIFGKKGKGHQQGDGEEIKKEEKKKEKIKKVEILYRRLKQKYTEEHDWPEVSSWHYGEKEMARKANWQKRFASILFLYWLFGGYGERPVRAGVWLGVFILAISVLTGFTCFKPSPESYGYEGIGAYLLNTLQYVTFQKETIFIPASSVAHWVALFARVVIPLQAALFVLAVRNRFRR